jgi:hypothetical protein
MHAGLELVLNWLAVIRVFHKVRKAEFDPKPGEIKENLQRVHKRSKAVKLRKAPIFLW